MLTLILINVQHLKNVAFSFEKGLNGQNHSSSVSCRPIKKFPPAKFLIPPPHNSIWRTMPFERGGGGWGTLCISMKTICQSFQ